jgi:nucleoside-diphosphate-sugar epimerase
MLLGNVTKQRDTKGERMRVLVLGGTGFVGRAMAEEAVARGHDVTVFNRGRRGAPPDGAALLVGDRTSDADVAALPTDFDVVMDCPVMPPDAVERTVRHFAGAVGAYALVSTIGVYVDPTGGPSEDSPVKRWTPETAAGRTGAFYGNDGAYQSLKAGCEEAVLRSFPDALVTRPGTILGPYEDKGRLPYWLSRVARGGRVVAPGRPGRPLQFVDARDLAIFMLHCSETSTGGIFNVMSAPGHATTGELLAECIAATGGQPELVWVDDELVIEHALEPGMCPPIWMPEAAPYEASLAADSTKALAAGLECRSTRDTVVDTWRWMQGLDGGAVPRRDDMEGLAGIPAEVEAKLLRLVDAGATR